MTTPQSNNPADSVSEVLEGLRRAYHYLLLLDAGRRDEAAALLAKVVAGPVGDVVFMAGGLASVTRMLAAGLSKSRRQAARQRGTELQRLFEVSKGSRETLTVWAAASGDHALRVARQRWPDRAARTRYYTGSAAHTFHGEEPGSDLRRRYFGER